MKANLARMARRIWGSALVAGCLLVMGGSAAGQEVPPPAPDAAKGAAEEAKESAEGAKGDAARDAREEPQDAGREAREGARDLREGTREAARDLREGARDAREPLRDDREDRPGDVRRPRPDTDLRDPREPGDDRPSLRDDRPEPRDDRSVRESSRSSLRSDTRIRTENLRSADLGIWFGRSTGEGLVISDVAATGPIGTLIADFGFREGDQIVAVDGYRVTREADFVRYLLADNEQVPVVVLRDGEQTTLHVEPIRLVQEVQAIQFDPLENFGVFLDDRITDRVLVWRVIPRSPAFYAGIQPGDVIATFHGQRVMSPDELVQIVESVEPGTIAVEVNRGQRVRQLDVELAEIEGRAAARTALRPEFDDTPIEGRSEMRLDASGGYVVPPARAPAPGPIRRALSPLFPRLRR